MTQADIASIIALWAVVFPEYGDPLRPQRDPRANIERKLAFGDGLFWLASAADRVVGTAMGGYDGHRGWIYSLGVHPDHRRSAIGQALVRHAEAALAAQGCPKINLQVMSSNVGAMAFWQRLGYETDAVLSLGRRLE